MKILLDTHIWLWYSLDSKRISPELLAKIADTQNELWLSPITVWETLLLSEKGRISLETNAVEWINQTLKEFKTQEAQLNHSIAVLSREIELPHQDPADRFLAATAIHYGLTLATIDINLANSSFVTTIS